MAGVAGYSSGVICRYHLWETFRLGAVGFVTAGADDGGVQLGRCDRSGIIGVNGLGSVAGFASDDHMLTLLFLINDVGMAGLAGVVAGKGNGPSGGFSDGISAIVAILPKTGRDDRGAQDGEDNHRYHNNGG